MCTGLSVLQPVSGLTILSAGRGRPSPIGGVGGWATLHELFDVADGEFAVGCHEVDEAVFVVPVFVVVFLGRVKGEGEAFAVGEALELVFSQFAEHFFFQ